MVELRPDERLDDLQCGGYRLIQRPGGFCFGTDAVLLAHFAAPRKKERAADLGCGNGIISILLAAHRPDISIEAVEIQSDVAEMAARSFSSEKSTPYTRPSGSIIFFSIWRR